MDGMFGSSTQKIKGKILRITIWALKNNFPIIIYEIWDNYVKKNFGLNLKEHTYDKQL